MTKRLFDMAIAVAALLLTGPVIVLLALMIWFADGANPFFAGCRVGLNGRDFRMVKLRTMVPRAEAIGGVSTAQSDTRLTRIGSILRRWKLDELPQFWNVLAGEMSVVGPRPNVREGGVDGYSPEAMQLLSVRPGITDIASIVFADEAQIIDGTPDPHRTYETLIWPWKCRLGLLYVRHHNLRSDALLIVLTVVAILARPLALRSLAALVETWGAEEDLVQVCLRQRPLAGRELARHGG